MTVNNFEGSFPTFSFTTRAFINSSGPPYSTLFNFGIEAGGDNPYTRTITLGIDANQGLRLNLNYDYGSAATQDYTTDSWINIAGVFDNGQLSLYVDGIQLGSTQASVNSINLESTDPNNYIGAGFSGSQQTIANFFDGQIDNLAFWNIALDESQVNYYQDSNITGDEEGLIGYWSFNSGSGDIAYDHTGNQKHGDVNGASWNLIPVPGDNNSLSFDGVDDYVNVSNASSLNINGNVSISAWVNFSNFDNDLACVMSKAGSGNGGYHIEKTPGANSLSLWIENGDDGPIGVTTNVLDADTWYHIVGTNDGTTSKIYVDGSLINSVSMGNPGGGEGDFKIGYNSDNVGSARYWHGNIDEVAIWDGALTADEITALYNTGLGLDASFNNGDYTSSSNLQGYWKFDANDGTIAYDHSGNANHGTINGPCLLYTSDAADE